MDDFDQTITQLEKTAVMFAAILTPIGVGIVIIAVLLVR